MPVYTFLLSAIAFTFVWVGVFGLVWFSLGWFSLVLFCFVLFGFVWFDLVWFGLGWFGLVWFDLVSDREENINAKKPNQLDIFVIANMIIIFQTGIHVETIVFRSGTNKPLGRWKHWESGHADGEEQYNCRRSHLSS